MLSLFTLKEKRNQTTRGSFRRGNSINDPANNAAALLSKGSLFKSIQNQQGDHTLLVIYLDLNDFHLKCKTNNLKVNIRDVKDVRYGWYTDAFNKFASTGEWKEDRCLSVVYGPKRKTLDLQAETVLTARSWVSAMLSLIAFSRYRGPENIVLSKSMKTREVNPEIKRIFLHYSEDKIGLSASELLKFLINEQKFKNYQTKDAERLIKTFKLETSHSKMTALEFYALINSPTFHILKEEHRRVNQDMTQPINNYFIASSHNTYLTGDQLRSKSSIEGYISALETGCRCLEIDLWDGPGNEPVVYHGYTRTSKILARDVLAKGIKPFAFKYSEYPLVLSVENHLSPFQQGVFAKYLKEIFHDFLCDEIDGEIPSPENLKRKVLIKATGSTVQCPSFRSLVNVATSSVRTSTSHIQVTSLSEVEALSLFNRRSVSNFQNSSVIIRIYPAGARVRSENFNPVPYWNVGCQMVALNYQTKSRHLELNSGMFRRNGNCGYVLKPENLHNSIGKTAHKTDQEKILRLRLISGHNLKMLNGKQVKIEGCYITVHIEGPDVIPKFKTRIIHKNWSYPYWNEVMEVKIRHPEMAIVCFSVKLLDESQSKYCGAMYALSLESLSTGYRTIPLNGEFSNLSLFASIFVHVLIKQ